MVSTRIWIVPTDVDLEHLRRAVYAVTSTVIEDLAQFMVLEITVYLLLK